MKLIKIFILVCLGCSMVYAVKEIDVSGKSLAKYRDQKKSMFYFGVLNIRDRASGSANRESYLVLELKSMKSTDADKFYHVQRKDLKVPGTSQYYKLSALDYRVLKSILATVYSGYVDWFLINYPVLYRGTAKLPSEIPAVPTFVFRFEVEGKEVLSGWTHRRLITGEDQIYIKEQETRNTLAQTSPNWPFGMVVGEIQGVKIRSLKINLAKGTKGQ